MSTEFTVESLWKLFAETDRQMKETALQMKENDRKLAQSREENERILAQSKKEVDRELKLLSKEIRELKVQLGGIGDKFGYFTEGMALPSMERILAKRFEIETVAPRYRVRRDGNEQEYDVLAWNAKTAVVVEVKSRVRQEAVAQLTRQLETLFEWVPVLEGRERIGILAGVDWVAGVREQAQSQGLYTARIQGEVFALDVPKGFEGRRW